VKAIHEAGSPAGRRFRQDEDAPGDDAPPSPSHRQGLVVGAALEVSPNSPVPGEMPDKGLGRRGAHAEHGHLGAGKGAVASVGPARRGGVIILSLAADSVGIRHVRGFLRGGEVRGPDELMAGHGQAARPHVGAIGSERPGVGVSLVGFAPGVFGNRRMANLLIDEIR